MQSIIDDLGRFRVPHTLRRDWSVGDAIGATLDEKIGILSLELANEEATHTYSLGVIDSYWRLSLPLTLRKTMNWGTGDTIFINKTSDTVAFTVIKKYREECTICKSSDLAIIMNGRGFCRSCSISIAKATG